MLKSNHPFKDSCVAAIVTGFVTHAFSYFNTTYFHDRYSMFLPVQFDSACRAKWMAQYVDLLTIFAYLPWLFGVLTLVFFALSVYMITEILDIQYTLNIWLIAGVCITNASVINAHMYWSPEILSALPLALASVWIWKKEKIHIGIRIGLGMLFVGSSLACYGAYTSAAPSLVIIVLFFALSEGQKWDKILKRGIEYVITFLAGMGFYYIVLRLFLYFGEHSLWNYANENRLVDDFPDLFEIFSLIKQAWYSSVVMLNKNTISQVMLIISISLFAIQLIRQQRKNLVMINFALMFILICIFPLSVGLIHVLAFGKVHLLMQFTYVIPFIGMIALLDREYICYSFKITDMKHTSTIFVGVISIAMLIVFDVMISHVQGRLRNSYLVMAICAAIYVCYVWFLYRFKSGINTMTSPPKNILDKIAVCTLVGGLTVLMCVKIYLGVLSANMAYAQLDKMERATMSLTTRLVERVETCEGFEGNEEIMLIGNVQDNSYLSMYDSTGNSTWEYWDSDILYNYTKNGVTNTDVLAALVRTNTGIPLRWHLRKIENYTPEYQQLILNMPIYPADGSVKKIENTVVIKLSEE